MGAKAVVLFSGGLDSTTVLAIAKATGYEVFPLSIEYGQRHVLEIAAAKNSARKMEIVEPKIVKIDLNTIGGSALTAMIEVPKDRSDAEMGSEIPITYVPARNTIMLAVALGYAEVLEADDIFVGVNAVDYSGYPDCRPEFIRAFENLANLATKRGVEGHRITVHAPLREMSKLEIIKAGLKLGVDYSLTHSCYDPTPEGKACGRCDSCLIRKHAFDEPGMTDPVLES